MRRLLLPTLLIALTCNTLVAAQPLGPSPTVAVRNWYQHYLNREPDQSGLVAWTDSLRSGNHPALVLASILGSDEYFAKAGNTREGFVRTLFLDVAGREPTRRELGYWVNRLSVETNRDVAYAFLLNYPAAWQP